MYTNRKAAAAERHRLNKNHFHPDDRIKIIDALVDQLRYNRKRKQKETCFVVTDELGK